MSGGSFVQNTATGVGGGGAIDFGHLTLKQVTVSGNTAPVNGGGINTQPNGVTTLVRSDVTQNTSGSLGGGISNLGTTTLQGTTVKQNTGSAGGGIATANNNVTLKSSKVTNNAPGNCNPSNAIKGCVN
jgi:predicted outer membrane repeat protein